MIKPIAKLGIAGLLVAVAAAIVYAPHLPRLVWEGYPRATWPAPGTFAAVAGGMGDPLPSAALVAAPEAGLRDLFEATDGRALLVAHDGRLAMEHYAPGVGRETRLNSYSLVKSLIAALTLKAVAEQRIGGLETPVGSLLPSLASKDIGRLPLCRVLDMRSGVLLEPGGKKGASGFDAKDLEATKLNLLGPLGRLHTGGLSAVMDRLVSDETRNGATPRCGDGIYSYQNVNTAIAGAILEQVYGEPLEVLIAGKIWKPAKAAPADWRRYGDGLPVTPYCCLYARPMDWLRIAQFLLDNGVPGYRFLPENLWRLLMGSNLSPDELRKGRYGLFTYHNLLDRPGEPLQGPFAYFFGSRGQAVYLVPERRLAVVRFGGRVQLLHSTLYGVGRSLGIGPSTAATTEGSARDQVSAPRFGNR